MLHFKDAFESENYKVLRHCIGSFGVNTFTLICKKTKEAAIIDPGGQAETLVADIQTEGAKVTHLLFTHTHIDHIYGAEALKKALPEAKIVYHGKDQIVVDNIASMCRMFGVPVCTMPAQDIDLEKIPEFNVGALQLRSILTPGHTPGSVCFYIAEEKMMFSGDTLFKGNVGRTDFEGGSGFDLRKSLDLLVSIIPDDVKIYPGHGKYTQMDAEKANNFYMRVDRWR